MKEIIRNYVTWLPALVWMGLIFVFSSRAEPVPAIEGKPYEELVGNLLHLAEYGGLTFLLYFGWLKGEIFQSPPSWKGLILSALLAAAFGVTDELHQAFVPSRTFNPLDMALDACGAVLGIGLTIVVIWVARKD